MAAERQQRTFQSIYCEQMFPINSEPEGGKGY